MKPLEKTLPVLIIVLLLFVLITSNSKVESLQNDIRYVGQQVSSLSNQLSSLQYEVTKKVEEEKRVKSFTYDILSPFSVKGESQISLGLILNKVGQNAEAKLILTPNKTTYEQPTRSLYIGEDEVEVEESRKEWGKKEQAEKAFELVLENKGNGEYEGLIEGSFDYNYDVSLVIADNDILYREDLNRIHLAELYRPRLFSNLHIWPRDPDSFELRIDIDKGKEDREIEILRGNVVLYHNQEELIRLNPFDDKYLMIQEKDFEHYNISQEFSFVAGETYELIFTYYDNYERHFVEKWEIEIE